MADVSIIVDKNGTEFAIADTTARADVASAETKITAIETRLDNITKLSATINTQNASWGAVSRNSMAKNGHIVQFSFRFVVKPNLGYGAELLNGLPKPHFPTPLQATTLSMGSAMCFLTENGVIQTSDGTHAFSSGTQIVLEGCYISDE